jgi:hypothetical protein
LVAHLNTEGGHAFVLIQTFVQEKNPVSLPFQKPLFEALKSGTAGFACPGHFI